MNDQARQRAEIAVGLIVAEDGRLLLQHRDDRPDVNGAGLWGLFGGHLEPGESYSAAFLRELSEELGWRPRHFEHYLTRDTEYTAGERGYNRAAAFTSHLFAAHLDLPVEGLTLGEGQALALFPPGDLPEALLRGLANVIEEFARSDAYKRVKRRWDFLSTTGLLVDAQGRFLLQLRDDDPGILHPGLWGSFGGRLEPYETPDEGFLRELEEELSWRPSSHELYVSSPVRTLSAEDPRSQLIYIYAAPVDVALDTMVLGEGRALDVFARDALPENTVPPLRALIERFVETETYRYIMDRARTPPT